MKIAVIGVGKTGGELLKLIPPTDVVGPFNSKNPVTPEALKTADVGILFVPGDIFLQQIPQLLASGKPMVIGATGMSFPSDLDQRLRELNLSWVHATNFSLGIQLMRQWLKTLNRVQKSFPSFKANLLDIHHTKKLDAPSGTAKSLAKWCEFPVEIEARREGDVVGFHELTLHFAQETLKISHNAHNRALFAQGALEVAKLWTASPLGAGLHPLEDLMDHLERT